MNILDDPRLQKRLAKIRRNPGNLAVLKSAMGEIVRRRTMEQERKRQAMQRAAIADERAENRLALGNMRLGLNQMIGENRLDLQKDAFENAQRQQLIGNILGGIGTAVGGYGAYRRLQDDLALANRIRNMYGV